MNQLKESLKVGTLTGGGGGGGGGVAGPRATIATLATAAAAFITGNVTLVWTVAHTL